MCLLKNHTSDAISVGRAGLAGASGLELCGWVTVPLRALTQLHTCVSFHSRECLARQEPACHLQEWCLARYRSWVHVLSDFCLSNRFCLEACFTQEIVQLEAWKYCSFAFLSILAPCIPLYPDKCESSVCSVETSPRQEKGWVRFSLSEDFVFIQFGLYPECRMWVDCRNAKQVRGIFTS